MPSTTFQHDEKVEKAKTILRGKGENPAEMLKLAKSLAGQKQFGYARRLLARARQHEGFSGLGQNTKTQIGKKHALYTYKDPDLPKQKGLADALKILEKIDDVPSTVDQETLGLVGAIHKRRWEMDGQKQHLERSLAYYLRGYQEGVEKDYGYTAINAAYILDLLASLEEADALKVGIESEVAQTRFDEAKDIREQIIANLPQLPAIKDNEWLNNEWWFFVTVAEAYFGLQQYKNAGEWLERAKALPDIPLWEFEATARQLATIARLHGEKRESQNELESSEIWSVLREFLGGKAGGLQGIFIGKVGLALSGGGFRSSFYHIGVLAKLAELDMLRHVEVLSCVSGGSIIGAHYYLELRKLLQEKKDGNIPQKDYIDLVKKLEEDFLVGVQRNIRTRVAANLLCNLKMLLPSYSRTHRLGELYEKELYSRVQDGEGEKERWLNELFVEPVGPDGNPNKNFSPKYENWTRSDKVPMLILNATSLNTGHNWQFTSSFMGEPPGAINTDIDTNNRLRRMYFHDAPQDYQQFRLGYAVAASSCVPGLFEPLTLPGLYPDRTVGLVDGGVHDNQGTAGLLEQDCNVLLVSDASGQMESQSHPSQGTLGVPLRSNDVLMARVRDIQFRELETRRRSGLLRGLMFIHLKKDLDTDPIDWLECDDPKDASDEARPVGRRGPLANYGLRKDMAQLIAGIRTDLDSFSDTEAFALMTSGYRMAEFEITQQLASFPKSSDSSATWDFLGVEKIINKEPSGELQHQSMKKLLELGGTVAFKVWKQSRGLQLLLGILAIGLIAGLVWVYQAWSEQVVLTVGGVMLAIGFAVLGLIVGKKVMKIVRFRETLVKLGVAMALAVVGAIAAWTHVLTFDKLFLRLGRVKGISKD